jgi:hypothetical protein
MRSVVTAAACLLLGVAETRAMGQEAPAPAPASSAPPKEAAPQQEEPRSKELEELLRKLASEHAGRAPASEAPASGAHAVARAPTDRVIHVTRMADVVQVVHAGAQRELAYWDKHAEMGPGDELRQGPKAVTLVDYSDGASFKFEGPAILRFTSDGLANPRLLEIERLSRSAFLFLGRGDVDTVLTLPGGNELAGRNARVTLHDFDLRALEIRNSGPDPVVLRSPYLGATLLTLEKGHRVLLPVLAEPSAFVPHLTHDASTGDEARGRLVVTAQPEIGLRVDGDAIEVHGDGPVTAIARACGARVVLRPGEQMRLARAPIGAPRKKEWDE